MNGFGRLESSFEHGVLVAFTMGIFPNSMISVAHLLWYMIHSAHCRVKLQLKNGREA